MANSGQGDKHYNRMASGVGVLAAKRHDHGVRSWWQVWRWPATLLAGVVLWLALVAIAGAAPHPDEGANTALPATVAVHGS